MKRYTSLIIGLLFLVSCQNYLNVQPQGMVLPKTDEEFAAIIHTHLRNIEGGGDDHIIGNMEDISEREGCADDLHANISIGRNLVPYAGSDLLNKKQSDYRETWQVIKDCNIVIENIQGRESEIALNTLSAAYAIKAICYYNLIRDFCEPWDAGKASSQLGLPIVDHFDVTSQPGRSDLEETARYALQLFDNSIALHPSDPLFIFTEDIVKAFKARLLFWIEDWENCKALCQEVMETSKIRLTPIDQYEEVINSPTERKGEILLRSHINNSSELDWYFSYIKGYIASRPASSRLIRLFGEEPEKDIRFEISFDGRRCNTKVPEVRLRISELLLMSAECEYHLGNEQAALDQINLLRENRIRGVVPIRLTNLPPLHEKDKITEDAEGKEITPLLQLIFDERRKELYMEGDRWFELKRNGRPEWWIITNGLKYVTRKYLYTAPIYKRDVDMNEGMVQNPGYIY